MKRLLKKIHFRIHLKSGHLLMILTFFCLSAITAALSSGITTAPLSEAAGYLVVPFENSVARIGSWLYDFRSGLREKKDLLEENEELKAQVESLEGQLTDTQMALCDVYELLVPGDGDDA